MKTITNLILCIGLFVLITSCESSEVDPVTPADIYGTYISSNIETSIAGYEDEIATILVTEIDSTRADIKISFTNEMLAFIPLDNVLLTEGEGSTVNLERVFQGSSVTGNLNGETIQIDIDYNSGAFANFTGSK